MDTKDFNLALSNALELPFNREEVAGIESNCGSTWITLKNDKVYVIQFMECENEENEIAGQPNG